MALVLPVFVLAILGVIEIGRAMMLTQVLENAARNGVRSAILGNTTNAQVTTTVQSLVQNTSNVPTSNVTVTIGVNGSNGASLSTANPGDTISVSVQVPFAAASWVPPNYLKGKTLTALCTMPHE
jgi:Flp pilus assembly protein TadG